MLHDRSARIPSRLGVVVALVVMMLATLAGVSTPAHAQASATWVAEAGADTNPGTEAAPFRTLQKALDLARPGTTINLKPGKYTQAVITKVDGTAAAPITIKGPQEGRDKAVLYGAGGRVFSIDHSYYTLDGFTIDGQRTIARSRYEGTPLSRVQSVKDGLQGDADNSKLIYVGAGTKAGITGTTISNMFLTGSGGECVRFRNQTTNGLIVNSVIQWCGMKASGSGSDQYKYHNAEGVYVGTSPKSTTQPFYTNDTSNNIVVKDSTVNTFGSECFEVKENAHHNRMENVECGFNDEPLSFQGSNVELRGDHNTVVGSRLSNSRSWNLKLASDEAKYDKGGNTAQGTTFSGAATYPIVNKQTGSGPFCGNTIPTPISDPSGKAVTNTPSCTGSAAPTVTARTPTADATAVAVGEPVTATFSEPVQGIGESSFTLKADTTAVSATVTYDSATRVATLKPNAALAAGTRYTATLTSGSNGVRSLTGTPLATTQPWNFTTAGTTPTTPPPTTTPPTTAPPTTPPVANGPTVTARTPAENATAIAFGSNVTATFSAAVRGVSNSSFKLRADGATSDLAAGVSYNSTTRMATLDPSSNLAANTRYTATLTGGTTTIRDTAGKPLTTTTWSFTTAAPPPDTARPTVTGRSPSNGATNVSRTGNLTVTFSEAVNNVSTATVILKSGTSTNGSVVTAAIARDGTSSRWIINPDSTLSSRSTYTVYLTNGITDTAGNQLSATSWRFTTGR